MDSQFLLQNPKEYKPKYLVRLLGRMYDELVLRNVFSISTTISTVDPNGHFQIVLDNRYPPEQFWSLFHMIKPMDYIEIFMRRDDSIDIPDAITVFNNDTKNIVKKITQFGYIGPSTTGVPNEGVFYPASQLVISPQTGEPTPFIIKQIPGNPVNIFSANGGLKNARVDGQFLTTDSNGKTTSKTPVQVARPLNALEKANTPDFVFCGLIDSIETNFAMAPTGEPQAFIVISGRSMGKILTTHEVYQNSVITNPLIAKTILNVRLNGLSPSEAVKTIINTFLMQAVGYLPPQYLAATGESFLTSITKNPVTSPSNPALIPQQSVDTLAIDEFNSVLASVDNTVSTITTNQGPSRTFAIFRRKFITALSYLNGYPFDPVGDPVTEKTNPTLYNLDDTLALYAPGVQQMSPVQFAASNHDIYGNPVGRMFQNFSGDSQNKISALANVTDGALFNSLSQIGNQFLNELWIDECGRIVLRFVSDAWYTPLYLTTKDSGQTGINAAQNPFTINSANVSERLSLIENIIFNADGTPVLLSEAGPLLDEKGNAIFSNAQQLIVNSNTNIIEGEDIISWKFSKSDEKFKTLMVVNNLLNLTGGSPPTFVSGSAPLSGSIIGIVLADYVTNQVVSTFEESNTITDPQKLEQFEAGLDEVVAQAVNTYVSENPSNYLENTQQLIKTLEQNLNNYFTENNIPAVLDPGQIVKNALQNKVMRLLFTPFNFLTYNLSNSFELIDFWQDFLIRIQTSSNIFSVTPLNTYKLAYFFFLQNAQLFAGGHITVKGDPKYKAGQRVYIRTLNADFYVQAVSHDFKWGTAPYTTTLALSHGTFFGTLSMFNSSGNIGQSTLTTYIKQLGESDNPTAPIYQNLSQ